MDLFGRLRRSLSLRPTCTFKDGRCLFFVVLATAAWRTCADGVQHVTCTKISSCVCEVKGGGKIDLSPLDKKSGQASFSAKGNDGSGDTYKWNPCTDFTEPNQYLCSNVAACQVRPSDAYGLGNQASSAFITDPQKGLQISYNQTDEFGQKRTSFVSLKCGTDKVDHFTAEGEQPVGSAKFYMTIQSPHCCAPGSGALSVGSVLLIILFALLFVYLVGGMLFMKFVRGAQGQEVVPNVSFWKDFPSLVKKGALFTTRQTHRPGYEAL